MLDYDIYNRKSPSTGSKMLWHDLFGHILGGVLPYISYDNYPMYAATGEVWTPEGVDESKGVLSIFLGYLDIAEIQNEVTNLDNNRGGETCVKKIRDIVELDDSHILKYKDKLLMELIIESSPELFLDLLKKSQERDRQGFNDLLSLVFSEFSQNLITLSRFDKILIGCNILKYLYTYHQEIISAAKAEYQNTNRFTIQSLNMPELSEVDEMLSYINANLVYLKPKNLFEISTPAQYHPSFLLVF